LNKEEPSKVSCLKEREITVKGWYFHLILERRASMYGELPRLAHLYQFNPDDFHSWRTDTGCACDFSWDSDDLFIGPVDLTSADINDP
jgi:hypothetical protein